MPFGDKPKGLWVQSKKRAMKRTHVVHFISAGFVFKPSTSLLSGSNTRYCFSQKKPAVSPQRVLFQCALNQKACLMPTATTLSLTELSLSWA